MDNNQLALAAEIRAQVAARREVTAKGIQQAIGMGSSTWNNYFVTCTRDPKISIVWAVADQLGMKASELLALAEARAARPVTLSEHIASQLSPEAQEGIRTGREIVAGQKAKKRRIQGQ